jgi:hypothetical protein
MNTEADLILGEAQSKNFSHHPNVENDSLGLNGH